MKRLDLVVGSDGAGKSTLIELTLGPLLPGIVYVNADEISYAVLIPQELAVLRVQHRVRADGHDVSESKIRQRYQRLWDLVAAAASRADEATFFDNSTVHGPRIVAQLSAGIVVGIPTWPAWAPTPLSTRWPGN